MQRYKEVHLYLTSTLFSVLSVQLSSALFIFSRWTVSLTGHFCVLCMVASCGESLMIGHITSMGLTVELNWLTSETFHDVVILFGLMRQGTLQGEKGWFWHCGTSKLNLCRYISIYTLSSDLWYKYKNKQKWIYCLLECWLILCSCHKMATIRKSMLERKKGHIH